MIGGSVLPCTRCRPRNLGPRTWNLEPSAHGKGEAPDLVRVKILAAEAPVTPAADGTGGGSQCDADFVVVLGIELRAEELGIDDSIFESARRTEQREVL